MSEIKLSRELLNIVVAYSDKNHCIGKDNDLPWKRSLGGDLAFINKLVRLEKNVAIVTGSRTYSSMPRKKDLTEIVLTRDKSKFKDLHSNTVVCCSLKEAVDYCKKNDFFIVIFGGEGVYKEALTQKCKLFCTVVEEDGIAGDRCYPGRHSGLQNISGTVAKLLEDTKHNWQFEGDHFTENGFKYRFYTGYSD